MIKRKHQEVYSNTGNLWRYYRDEPGLDGNSNVIDVPTDNNSGMSFKFEEIITGKTGNDGTKDVELMISLKYRSNFWRTLEIP